jgi:hypothetical protein
MCGLKIAKKSPHLDDEGAINKRSERWRNEVKPERDKMKPEGGLVKPEEDLVNARDLK